MNRRSRVVLSWLVAGMSTVGAAPAAFPAYFPPDCSTWRRVGGPEARTNSALAFDTARGVGVLFGGSSGNDLFGDTWEWNGSSWRPASTTGPVPRSYHSMAYDDARGRTLLFGGHARSGSVRDTWAWDGHAWSQIATGGPPNSTSAPMVFDSARGVTVLQVGAQTWELASDTWTLRVSDIPVLRPAAMAFDALRARSVLVGRNETTRLRDTWEWDGSAWSLRESISDLPMRDPSAAFDSARGVTVFSQTVYRNSTYVAQTLEWDGHAWTEPVNDTMGFWGSSAMAFDDARQETLACCGIRSNRAVATLRAWDGQEWRIRADLPPAHTWGAMAFDTARLRTVMFADADINGTAKLPATWEFDGTNWHEVPSPGPEGRRYFAMAYDAARAQTVLFGGTRFGAILGDTWEWDGASWTLRAQSGPAHRYGHAMTYDAARGVTVLVAGHTGLAYAGDTWEWNGKSWTQRSHKGPSPRFAPSLAYDSSRNVCVLFGGIDALADLDDTWEWDGAEWTRRSPATSPPARSESAMAFDSARGLIVLHAGVRGATALNDVWEWDGTEWLQRSLVGPAARRGHAMAFDNARGSILMFGGFANSYDRFTDTWELAGIVGPAIQEHPADTLVPELGRLVLRVEATGAEPLNYQWYRDTLPVPGANGPTLVIDPVTRSHAGAYVAEVTNTCAGIQSSPAQVSITPCAANWNADDRLDSRDFFDFLSDFFAGDADFDADGTTTSADFFTFLAAWFTGC